MAGYIFRFTILILCVITVVVSARIIIKGKSIKTHIKSVVSFLVALVVFVGSFISIDIKNPKIEKALHKGSKIIADDFSPDTNNPKVYNVYEFDCDGYYGTVAVSFCDDKTRNNDLLNRPLLRIEDEKTICLYSEVACVRDIWGLPNQSIGMMIIYHGDVRIAIKYTYKDEKNFWST